MRGSRASSEPTATTASSSSRSTTRDPAIPSSTSSTPATSSSRSVTPAPPSPSDNTAPPSATSSVAVHDIPAFGWRTFTPVDGLPTDDSPEDAVPDSPKLRQMDATSAHERRSFGAAAVAYGRVIENGLVRVEVDAVDGTLTIEADGVRITGANRYVDGGDGGDTYNYSPPGDDLIVDTPESVTVEVADNGGVWAQLVVTSRFRWPARAVGDERSCTERSSDLVDVDIRTTLELRAGERFLRVRVDFDNRARDHRLRAHYPLPTRVTGSDAECAFAVVHRDLTAEGGPHERGLPTFVSRRFVDCASNDGESDGRADRDTQPVGLALLHDGLLEYEVLDDGAELALTLLRATGYLSRSEPAYRPNPAGPLHTLEGPQLQRPLTLEYAVLPHRGDWESARVSDAADDFLVPLEAVRVQGPSGSFAHTGGTLTIDGAHVSAITRDANTDALTLRLVNLSPSAQIASVADTTGDAASGEVIDLVGERLHAFTGSVELRPWEIVTLRLASA